MIIVRLNTSVVY